MFQISASAPPLPRTNIPHNNSSYPNTVRPNHDQIIESVTNTCESPRNVIVDKLLGGKGSRVCACGKPKKIRRRFCKPCLEKHGLSSKPISCAKCRNHAPKDSNLCRQCAPKAVPLTRCLRCKGTPAKGLEYCARCIHIRARELKQLLQVQYCESCGNIMTLRSQWCRQCRQPVSAPHPSLAVPSGLVKTGTDTGLNVPRVDANPAGTISRSPVNRSQRASATIAVRASTGTAANSLTPRDGKARIGVEPEAGHNGNRNEGLHARPE